MSQSQVLAPSATMLTESNNGMESFPFQTVVRAKAEQKLGKNASGRGISKFSLNREKLAASVIAEFRRQFPACCVGNSKDIPAQYHKRIWDEVNKFVEFEGNIFNVDKIENVRSAVNFRPNFKDGRIDTEVRKWGTVQVNFERQVAHCDIHIEYLEKQLARRIELNSKPGEKEPDYQKEKALETRIEKFRNLKAVILNKQENFSQATK